MSVQACKAIPILVVTPQVLQALPSAHKHNQPKPSLVHPPCVSCNLSWCPIVSPTSHRKFKAVTRCLNVQALLQYLPCITCIAAGKFKAGMVLAACLDNTSNSPLPAPICLPRMSCLLFTRPPALYLRPLLLVAVCLETSVNQQQRCPLHVNLSSSIHQPWGEVGSLLPQAAPRPSFRTCVKNLQQCWLLKAMDVCIATACQSKGPCKQLQGQRACPDAAATHLLPSARSSH